MRLKPAVLVWPLLAVAAAPGWIRPAAGSDAAAPDIAEVRKIWDRAPHSAFTDLIRFENRWYCSFREGEGHVYGEDGTVRIIMSEDGDEWRSAALLSEEGVDLRDPKLSVTPDGRLMAVMGGSVYEGREFITRKPRVAFSNDGSEWTEPVPVMDEGDWLWRVTWFNGRAYGVSYDINEENWRLKLVRSDDGVNYEILARWDIPGRPNETTLRFTDEGEMIALIRREADTGNAWIGTSRPPYAEWTFEETDLRVGGPNFIILPNGELWASGRHYPGGATTVLFKMTRGSLEPVLTLPSGGDTSYPGMVFHDGLLWMSYYSSHEGKTSIHLAKIELPG